MTSKAKSPELLRPEEPDVGRTQEPIVGEVRTQELIVEEVETQEPIVEEVGTQEPIVEEKKRSGCLSIRMVLIGPLVMTMKQEYKEEKGQKFTIAKEAQDRSHQHFIESRRNLKLYKNDSVRVRARCDGKVHVFTMSQGTGPTGPKHGMKVGPSGSSGSTTRSKKRKNTCTNDDNQHQR
ncbi:hypothetical protein Tco_1405417 [Tanacetum coccineum]